MNLFNLNSRTNTQSKSGNADIDAIARHIFRAGWFQNTHGSQIPAKRDPFEFYIGEGWKRGLDPTPMFDTQWYLRANGDVDRAGINPFIHFLTRGWLEHRAPHPFFDLDWYIQSMSRSDGHAPETNHLTHYLTEGVHAQASPHPLFDPLWFVETYSDQIPTGFTPFEAFLADRTQFAPNPYFDGAWYLSEYTDVAAAKLDPFEHYVSNGEREGRWPSQRFHSDWYIRRYPDVAKSGLPPLQHYLSIGRASGHFATAFDESQSTPMAGAVNIQAPQTSKPQAEPNLRIEPRAGQLVEGKLDSAGARFHPPYRFGDGRRLSAIRGHHEHHWYDSEEVRELANALGEASPLGDITKLLVIGHDFGLKTGVLRSLSHYLSAIHAIGGVEITSLELASGSDAMLALHDIEAHDFVIFNSLPPFFNNENGLELLKAAGLGKAAIYLHETDFVFDRLEKQQPERYQAFADGCKDVAFLTVSSQQEEMLQRRFGAAHFHRVYETSPMANKPSETSARTADPLSDISILMAGTLQPRKGVSLFSEVADLAAAQGLNWSFSWAGGDVGMSDDIYKSENVNFLGHLDAKGLLDVLSDADVFLLSSKDDPFPLACLEALQLNKHVVAYKETGTSEILGPISGCAVFDTHTPEAALAALRDAIGSPIVPAEYNAVNEAYNLESFVRRMNGAVCTIASQTPASPKKQKPTSGSVAVIVHLYYHDLWHDIARAIENTRHLTPDLYVTLSDDKSDAELEVMKETIRRRWPSATILVTPNRGMDVGPFVEVVNLINAQHHAYKYVLKLHSKKSLSASGETNGAAWRQTLFHGLAGTPLDVDRIISTFEENPEIGMVGVDGMLLQQSSNDRSDGRNINEDNMNALADRMGLSDRQLDFFRGTMFWARAATIFEPINRGDISIDDFESGHQPDASRAHAMERLFACMVRHSGLKLHAYNPELPKPISLLKGRHRDEDIYIIGAGASAGLIDPDFFRDKVTIGVNRVFVRFDCTYLISKETGGIASETKRLDSGAIPIVSKWDSGNIRQGKMRSNLMSFKRPEYYFFDHGENTREIVDLSVVSPNSDSLVVSYSTLTTAMHFAVYLGARNIILVGHDCGLLDGKSTFDGYNADLTRTPWKQSSQYSNWLTKIEPQSLAVKEKLVKEFGVSIHSLNPFINFNLEGRSFVGERTAMQIATPEEASLPVLLLCDGPSAKDLACPADIDNLVIARVGSFFLEDKPFAGGRVDHLFWSVNDPTFHQGLKRVLSEKRYNIRHFNCPVDFTALSYGNEQVHEAPFLDPADLHDYWSLIASRPQLAELMMRRPLPTTGVQAVAALAIRGHRHISVAGLDFYDSGTIRHQCDVADEISSRIDPKHLKPGYEKGAHSREADIRFLNRVFDEFPDLVLKPAADMPILEQVLSDRKSKVQD